MRHIFVPRRNDFACEFRRRAATERGPCCGSCCSKLGAHAFTLLRELSFERVVHLWEAIHEAKRVAQEAYEDDDHAVGYEANRALVILGSLAVGEDVDTAVLSVESLRLFPYL